MQANLELGRPVDLPFFFLPTSLYVHYKRQLCGFVKESYSIDRASLSRGHDRYKVPDGSTYTS